MPRTAVLSRARLGQSRPAAPQMVSTMGWARAWVIQDKRLQSCQPSKPLGLHRPSHRLTGKPRDNDRHIMRLSPRWQQKQSPYWNLHHPRIRELRCRTHLPFHSHHQTVVIVQKNQPTAHRAPQRWQVRRRQWTCRARLHTRGRMSMHSCTPRGRESTTQLVLGLSETARVGLKIREAFLLREVPLPYGRRTREKNASTWAGRKIAVVLRFFRHV